MSRDGCASKILDTISISCHFTISGFKAIFFIFSSGGSDRMEHISSLLTIKGHMIAMGMVPSLDAKEKMGNQQYRSSQICLSLRTFNIRLSKLYNVYQDATGEVL